jgi:hypothetical protein
MVAPAKREGMDVSIRGLRKSFGMVEVLHGV